MDDSMITIHMEFSPEAYREQFFHSQRGTFLVAAIYAALVAARLGALFLDFPFLPLGLQLNLLFILVLLVLLAALPFIRYYVVLRRTRKLYGQEIPPTDICFGDTITADGGGNHAEFRYEWVKKTRVLRYSYVIVMKDRRSLRIQYDSFTKGDLDGLRALLREKCPKLRVK